jgi:myo-inositol-1(or 4)-monophosphatase
VEDRTGNSSPVRPDAAETVDARLVESVIEEVHAAGARLMSGFSPTARPDNGEDMFLAASISESLSLGPLQAALAGALPAAGWVEDEGESAVLGDGDWWVVDAVEGNVNYIHGSPEWCVSVALVRNNAPVLAVVHEPVGGRTYTATAGGGAWLNGKPLRTSRKTDLASALATTAQAAAGQRDIYHQIGASITAMLEEALLVRATVPSTFPLLMVAAGHADVFWQYQPVLTGIAPGMLLVAEAGGTVTDIDGQPWRPGSRSFLASAPGVHRAAAEVLSSVPTP